MSSPLSYESEGAWKGLPAHNLFPGLHISHKNAKGSPSPGGEPGLQGRLLGNGALAAWVPLLTSLCTLFASSCLRSRPGTLLLFGEKECSHLVLFWEEVAGPVET